MDPLRVVKPSNVELRVMKRTGRKRPMGRNCRACHCPRRKAAAQPDEMLWQIDGPNWHHLHLATRQPPGQSAKWVGGDCDAAAASKSFSKRTPPLNSRRPDGRTRIRPHRLATSAAQKMITSYSTFFQRFFWEILIQLNEIEGEIFFKMFKKSRKILKIRK